MLLPQPGLGAAGSGQTGKQSQASHLCCGYSQHPSPCTEHSRWALELDPTMLRGVGSAMLLKTHVLVFCCCDVAVPVMNLHGKNGKAVNKLWAAPSRCEWTGQYWGGAWGPWEVTWGAHRSLYVPGSPRDAAPLSASTTMPAALNPSSCPSFCMALGSRISRLRAAAGLTPVTHSVRAG